MKQNRWIDTKYHTKNQPLYKYKPMKYWYTTWQCCLRLHKSVLLQYLLSPIWAYFHCVPLLPPIFFSFSTEITDKEKKKINPIICKGILTPENDGSIGAGHCAVWPASASICKPEGLSLLQNQMVWVLVLRENKRIGLGREKMRKIISDSAKLSYLYYFIILLLIAV